MKYRHLGIPTRAPQEGETYLPRLAFVLVDGAPVEFLQIDRED